MSAWTPGDAPVTAGKRHAPATLRNRDAIVEVLAAVLPATGLVLEIASGSGEHVVHFANAFQALEWQPSDPDADALASIAAWRGEAALPNLHVPMMLDAAAERWPVGAVDAILCINMVHISAWEATLGLMRGAGRVLSAGGLLYLYGPFLREGVDTAPSNLAFDKSLRARDPHWGLRSVDAVGDAATAQGLKLEQLVEMPANNLSLMFRKG